MNRAAHPASPSAFAGFTAGEFLRMVDAGAYSDLRVELVRGAATVHAMAGPAGDTYADRAVIRVGEPLTVPGTDATIVIEI
ncbi:hypothetical protein [Sphingomonas metalli]|uniref:hypothetical protein n=1 Tax=Sphingomonas metalli TaxID=1779358 RepID=UPI001662EC16|nr:hypothetical protein [Sphingomonas metalli]